MAAASSTPNGFLLKQFLSFPGPGFLVTGGFIDMDNWATNIKSGSQLGYQLLRVITLSPLMLIVIQHMADKLGVATGKSLAVNMRAFSGAGFRMS